MMQTRNIERLFAVIFSYTTHCLNCKKPQNSTLAFTGASTKAAKKTMDAIFIREYAEGFMRTDLRRQLKWCAAFFILC